MKTIRKILFVAGFTSLMFLGSNCGKLSTGVCTGFNPDSGTTYCKDGWTKEECDEWDDQEINGVSWFFHKGQTCEERGTPATP